ncbi:MAG: DUF3105 domain-containing protein [Kineosporiaceae bacterium]
MAKKSEQVERKARVEELRRAQQAKERRRTLLVVATAGVLVLALVGVVVVVLRDHVSKQDPATVGVAAAAAGCDAVITDPADGGQVHVGPGTDKPEETTVKYAQVPPSSGAHYASPQYPSVGFYSDKDKPRVESLVHNLEHGYTIVWFDPTLAKAQQDELRGISERIRDDKTSASKFIVTAWDPAYGAFPSGKKVAISHWGAKNGYRQLCATVSGEAIKEFMSAHPWTDAPEPNAA